MDNCESFRLLITKLYDVCDLHVILSHSADSSSSFNIYLAWMFL